MNSMMVRAGRPMVQWLADSDAGAWFADIAARVQGAMPHDERTMDVLYKIHNADARKDGSVRIEVIGRDEAEALHEWAGHVEYFTSQNAGHDARERGIMNSARALLRELEDYMRRLGTLEDYCRSMRGA